MNGQRLAVPRSPYVVLFSFPQCRGIKMVSLKYFYRSQTSVSPQAREYWSNRGRMIGSLLHPTLPQTLPQLAAVYARRYNTDGAPASALVPYLSCEMCHLIEHGFVRITCPAHWPTAQRPDHALTFQLNPLVETLRREYPAVWQQHGEPVIGKLLKTMSPLSLNEMDDACRLHAQRNKSFSLSPENKQVLAHSLFVLAEHDLVQLIVPSDFRHTLYQRNDARQHIPTEAGRSW